MAVEPEPAAKRQRRVWLSNNDRYQSVLLNEGDIGDDLRRKAKPSLNEEQLAYVKLVNADGAALDLFTEVPAGVGGDKDTAVKVVVEDGMPSTSQAPRQFSSTSFPSLA